MAKSDSISTQIDKLLNDYSQELKDKTNKIFEDEAKESARQLRQTSPQGTGRNKGAYAKSWTVKKQKDKNGLYTLIVHNKDHYQLTHLLEHGHALPQGGRANPRPHIADVEKWARDDVVRKIEEKV